MLHTLNFIIRKPSFKTPSDKQLEYRDAPPLLSHKDIKSYYNIMYYSISITNSDINSDTDFDFDSEEVVNNLLIKLYYEINSLHMSFQIKIGDIIELPNSVMYFFDFPPIKVNLF